MRLEVSKIQNKGFTEVEVNYKGRRLAWRTSIYSKVKLEDPTRIFLEFNGWLSQQSETTHDGIWQAYGKIRELMDLGLDPSFVNASLVSLIRELFSHIPLDSLRRWLLTVGDVHIPAEIEDTINEDSRYDKRDQTYLKNDYVNLATVAMALRPMIPIWGEYFEQGTEQDMHKENEVVGLIAREEIAHWPMEELDVCGEEVSSVFDKLNDYISFCVEREPITLGSLWRGMSSVEIPILLCSKVLVRRLTIVPLNDHNYHSIIANIFRYVQTNLSPPERSTQDRVAEKRPEGGKRDEDDKTSFVESHKTKTRVTPGDIVAYNLDALDYRLMATKVDPAIPLDLLEECIEQIEHDNNSLLEISDHQILLAQWVMAKAFPPKAFPHLNKRSINYLLATTQALLWHWNFKSIAVFLQVSPVYHGEYNSVTQLSQTKTSARISKKYKDDLDEAFPYMKLGRVNMNSPERIAPKPDNIAAIAINNLNNQIRTATWSYHGPKRLFGEAGQVVEFNKIVVPANIKDSLTELVIFLAQINK